MPATAAPPDRAAATAAPDRRHRAVLLVTCLALATVVAAMASLNVALPDIARATGGSQTQLSWIIDAYSLVFAALLLPAGAIGDRFGRRRALLVGPGPVSWILAGVATPGHAPRRVVVGRQCSAVAPSSALRCTHPNAAT
ncbi:MFS transporter [Kitasatospora purpeofusca]|uniref:MFS transporter n=1 Tax=Kitasatospora purpeofusca TaxID=67352 RepID=A0ABZ1U8B7_9ACTN|nr:MFS transporter [Kitasatospora purpeofusca]